MCVFVYAFYFDRSARVWEESSSLIGFVFVSQTLCTFRCWLESTFPPGHLTSRPAAGSPHKCWLFIAKNVWNHVKSSLGVSCKSTNRLGLAISFYFSENVVNARCQTHSRICHQSVDKFTVYNSSLVGPVYALDWSFFQSNVTLWNRHEHTPFRFSLWSWFSCKVRKFKNTI